MIEDHCEPSDWSSDGPCFRARFLPRLVTFRGVTAAITWSSTDMQILLLRKNGRFLKE